MQQNKGDKNIILDICHTPKKAKKNHWIPTLGVQPTKTKWLTSPTGKLKGSEMKKNLQLPRGVGPWIPIGNGT